MTGPVHEDKRANTITSRLKNNYKLGLSLMGCAGQVRALLG